MSEKAKFFFSQERKEKKVALINRLCKRLTCGPSICICWCKRQLFLINSFLKKKSKLSLNYKRFGCNNPKIFK